MAEPLLRVENLVKHFAVSEGAFSELLPFRRRSRKAVHAVDGITFSIYEGRSLGVVGESGCGKTTLSRCVLRLIRPDGGRIYFGGLDLLKAKGEELRSVRRKMQAVFQDPVSSLDPRMRIRDTIAEPLEGNSRGEIADAQISSILNLVGLDYEHLSRFPHEFSGGQRQRICIARALVTRPEFVVLDEPTSALDASVQAQILNLLIDLKKRLKLSYLLISHHLDVVKHLSDMIAVMYLGKIVELATAKQLMEHPRHPYTIMLLASIPKMDPKLRDRKLDVRGELPSVIDPPSGCRFHPRCPYAIEKCKYVDPPLTETEDRLLACHNPPN